MSWFPFFLISIFLISSTYAYHFYALTQTLQLSFQQSQHLAFSFHKYASPSLIVVITYPDEEFKIFSYSTTSQICLESKNKGSVVINIIFSHFYNFTISQDRVVINASELVFDQTQPLCQDSVFLISTSFSEPVAQLKLENELQNTLESRDTNLTKLPFQNCVKNEDLRCLECLSGFLLASGTCSPYGCRSGVGSKCVACLSGYNLNAVTHKCEGGTSALVSNNSLATNPVISIDLKPAWGFRTYVMLLPSHDRPISSSLQMFSFSSNTSVSSIQATYNYALRPKPANILHILLKIQSELESFSTSSMHIPLGEWLSISLYKSANNVLKFSVDQYGESKISTPSNPPTSLTLGLNSDDLVVYVKDIRLWRGPDTHTHMTGLPLCKFTPAVREYAHLALDYSCDSDTTEMNDELGTLEPVQLQLKDDVQNVGDLIYQLQPIAELKSNYYHSQSHQTPTCAECLPPCAECSDLFTCTACAEGTLLNGLCILSNFNIQQGESLQTTFSFDQSNFKRMNEHAQSTLRTPDDLIEIKRAYLKYPDDTLLSIPDFRAFKVPNYRKSNTQTFEVQFVINYAANKRYFTSPVGSLTMTQDLYISAQSMITTIHQTKLESLSSNRCGCSHQGRCHEQLSLCTCESGFAGHLCQFSTSAVTRYSEAVTAKVEDLYDSYGMLQDSTILEDLITITTEADMIEDQTAITIIYLVEKVLKPATEIETFNRGFEVLSNLLTCARYESTTLLVIGQSIKEAIDEVLERAVEQKRVLQVSSSRIVANAAPLDFTKYHKYYPSSDSKLFIEIPAHFIDVEGEAWFVSVLYKERLYETKAPAGSVQASDVLKLDIYNDKGEFHIHDIPDPILLHFPLDRNNPVVEQTVQDLAEGHKSLSQFHCYYYDEKFREPSTRGCELRDLNENEMVCACTHMTDFVNFLETAPEVVQSSNYSVFHALTEMDAMALKYNVGVYLALTYWFSFLLLFFVVQEVDRRILKSSFYDKLYEFLNSLLASTEDYNESSPAIRPSKFNQRSQLRIRGASSIVPQSNDALTRSRRQRKTVTTFKINAEQDEQVDSNIELNNVERYSLGSDRALQSVPLDRVHGESFADFAERNKRSSLFQRLKRSKKSPFSWIKQIRRRIDSIVEQEKAKRRNCCCLFQRLARNELATNNIIYNIVSRTSPLTKRASRLTLLYLSLLLDITVCALFFDLTHSEPPEHVWDYIGQILWIGFYTVLITMLPTFILGALFSPPRHFLLALQSAEGKDDLMREYKRISKRLRCRLILAISFFFLLSHFLLLYLLCFCHVASTSMVQDWGVSALVAIMIDQIAFELIPSLILAVLGVMRAYCCRCSGSSCPLILVEVYRLYRNVV